MSFCFLVPKARTSLVLALSLSRPAVGVRTYTSNIVYPHSPQLQTEKEYVQLPEHLKLHSFTPELEILRDDELRAPFKDFLSSFISKLLESRAIEIWHGTKNSNPASRLSEKNVARFSKLASLLKQLFDLNGGNTEILDSIMQSQAALQAFESRQLAKRQGRTMTAALCHDDSDLFGPGPYMQIPESLAIHDFFGELETFRRLELRCKYAEVSAGDLLDKLSARLKEIRTDGNQNLGRGGVTQANLERFYLLHSKLRRLLVWNGGDTAILDTLLESQKAFEKVDREISNRQAKNQDALELSFYSQVPDDVFLEEYNEELNDVRAELCTSFVKASASQVLQAVSKLSELHPLLEKRLIFSKLYRNLAMLFKHNGGQTFVLDTILVSVAVLKKLESKLDMGPQAGSSKQTEDLHIKYRGSDHVIDLLNRASGAEQTIENVFEKEERTIQSALSQALSKEEKSVFEANPLEYEQIINLTPDKIRGKYRQRPDSGSLRQVERTEFEKYLRQIKHEKDAAEEYKWREQTAFEWSNALYKNHRSFAARNFFDPILGVRSTSFPMFPGTGEEQEYLILTSSGQKFHTQKNPLGMNHVPDDMFAILQTLSEDDLAKILRNVEKLRKAGWRLIGSGHSKGMLVLSRDLKNRDFGVGRLVKFILASSGICFAALVFINWLVDDTKIDHEERLIELNHSLSPENKTRGDEEARDNKNRETTQGQKPAWRKFLWV